MSSHLYACERCGKYGHAYYVLEPTDDERVPWRNVLICKACFELRKKLRGGGKQGPRRA
jgi:hypothetical protein